MSVEETLRKKLDALGNELLTEIELNEMKLLNWGFVDVRSPLKAMLPDLLANLSIKGNSLWSELQNAGVEPEDILENLEDRKLIFPSNNSHKEFYRSRFAETIRLLFLLRQRFSAEDWQTAPRLVSDFKVDVRRRSYPRRDVSVKKLCNELRARGADTFYIDVVTCLLKDPNGKELSLARFQEDAIIQHYLSLHHSETGTYNDRGLVIGAGTGAGKTKAFYIPAMAEIATNLRMQSRYVQALAIYPRNELLKDQLLEAYLEARKLDTFLRTRKKRPIAVGAYYGDTPYSAESLLEERHPGWIRTKQQSGVDGWECPYFPCPNCKEKKSTPQALVWYQEDVSQEVEANKQKKYGDHAHLRCPDCSFTIQGHDLLLTREQMIHTPPDILFTTTEMLNRRLSDAEEHNLFGVDRIDLLPTMLLLDEIHTYEGLHGANIAYLLRRWRHARCRRQTGRLCCVGLSATLNDAASFFSRLTGISPNLINYVRPQWDDMEVEGAEYNLVLKGDPVSAKNLLSTSIQTVMLLGRMLDTTDTQPSRSTYGRKIFAFTDKLDVLNRWYNNELDAEKKKVLSRWRKRERRDPEIEKKKQAGQDWYICTMIGHNLGTPLRIGLTSSQSRGVDSSANVVIATSTLEVGFNDSSVGAVIQHKTPCSMASFLQRKGRAGRLRLMRPWMVVVASAYGRDRWAFQHAENLFDPELKNIDIPLDNYYVRKIQATFALMDWFSLKLKDHEKCRRIDLWDVLRSDEKGRDRNVDQRRILSALVEDLLSGDLLDELRRYLRHALGLYEQREIDSVLWDEPRSLIFEVLPTIARQLNSNWQRLDNQTQAIEVWGDNVSRNPLPDFIPPTLFTDLKLLHIPLTLSQIAQRNGQTTQQAEPKVEYLSLQQCLSEFAPGHVSKRFSLSKNREEAHWLAIPDAEQLQDILPIKALSIEFDDVPLPFEIEGTEYQLFSPRAYELEQMPDDIDPSSSAQYQWQSHFASKVQSVGEEIDEDRTIALPDTSEWKSVFTAINSYTLSHGTWVEVARLATSIKAERRYKPQNRNRKEPLTLWLRFETEDHKPAAVGFVNHVDALRFQFQPLDIAACLNGTHWPTLYQNLRPEFFLYKFRRHKYVQKKKLTRFEVEWLWQLELSMLVATAVGKSCSLAEAASIVQAQRESLAQRTMEVIFQSQQAEDYGEEKVGPLHEKLRQRLRETDIVQALEECSSVLWQDQDVDMETWLRECYASSLGATLFAALTQMIPDADPDELTMDVDGENIWISEKTSGGVGLISQLASLLESNAGDFEQAMYDTLHHCERQELATQLQQVAKLVERDDHQLKAIFADLRQESDIKEQEELHKRLKAILDHRGISSSRELLVALHAKWLRSNSDQDSDELLAHLVRLWRQEEQRLNCKIDIRVIAVAALKHDEIAQRIQTVFQRIGGVSPKDPSQSFNILQSLLWLSCTDSCPDCIEESHWYQELVKPSRALLRSLLPPSIQRVVYEQPDWLQQVRDILSTSYKVQIQCSQDQLAACKQQILNLLVDPIPIGFQFLYPTIERIMRTDLTWTIELWIKEFAHA
jgi:hypothetical protein